LKEKENFVKDKSKSAVEKFKKKLRWNDDEKWFDRGGVGVLIYAVISDEANVVRELLQELKQNFKGVEYARRLQSRVRDEGFSELGISGGMMTLMAAMATASPEIVSMLLEYGANVESVDMIGNDAFMYASSMGRPDNLQCWLERFKNWDLNRKNTVLGGSALGVAVYIGANKLETVKILLSAGAQMDFKQFNGGTVLTSIAANEDSDPNVIRLLLEKLKATCKNNTKPIITLLNSQQHPSTFKWKSINFIAKTLYRTGASKSGLMAFLAIESGTTPLNLAVVRGDIEIVKILLEAGADPYVENDLGMNAFEICDKFGPFPSVHSAMQKHSAGS